MLNLPWVTIGWLLIVLGKIGNGDIGQRGSMREGEEVKGGVCIEDEGKTRRTSKEEITGERSKVEEAEGIGGKVREGTCAKK